MVAVDIASFTGSNSPLLCPSRGPLGASGLGRSIVCSGARRKQQSNNDFDFFLFHRQVPINVDKPNMFCEGQAFKHLEMVEMQPSTTRFFRVGCQREFCRHDPPQMPWLLLICFVDRFLSMLTNLTYFVRVRPSNILNSWRHSHRQHDFSELVFNGNFEDMVLDNTGNTQNCHNHQLLNGLQNFMS
jgi:hypothetical protein